MFLVKIACKTMTVTKKGYVLSIIFHITNKVENMVTSIMDKATLNCTVCAEIL